MDAFSLVARLTLDKDGYERGLGEARDHASSFASKLKGGLTTAAKVGGAALMAASGAVVALTKSAIDNYAKYEQLVGGVETLFKGSADKVQQYAAEAYKTAGLSANEYMETVTSFSASLIQSLGGDTAAAADLANVAITDMADNANKMGTDISSIQVAYAGFAKQNYTMLDNLKLGYGGTKSEMERLIRDAEKMDKSFSVTHTKTKKGADEISYSYADIVKAIHIVQEQMDITGTTAKEASETISGSLAAAKSAWDNLLTGVADNNADFDTLVDNFVDSVVTAAGNVIPRIEQTLKGIGKLVEGLAPVIVDTLPGMISNILPSVLSAAVAMVNTVVATIAKSLPAFVADTLPVIAKTISSLMESVVGFFSDNLHMLVQVATHIVESLALYIAEALPELIPAVVQIIYTLITALTSPDTLTRIVSAALAILKGLAQGLLDAIPVLLESVPVIWDNLIAAFDEILPEMLDVGIGIVVQIVDGIVKYMPQLLQMAITIVTKVLDTLLDHIPELIKAAITIIDVLADGISDALPSLIRQIPVIVTEILGALLEHAPELLVAGVELIAALANGILQSVGAILSAMGEIVVAITTPIGDLIKAALEWGGSIITNIGNGIVQKWQNLTKVVSSVAKFLGDTFKGMWEAAKTWGSNIIANVINGVVEKWNAGVKFFSDIGKNIRELFTNLVKGAKQWGSDMIQNFKNGITEMWNSAVDKVRGFADKIKSLLGFSEPEEGPLSDFHTYAPDMMKLFAKGIRDNERLVTDAIDDTFNFGTRIVSGADTGFSGGQEFTVPRQEEPKILNIVFKLADDTELGRAIYRLYNDEAQRVGVKLAGGVL